MEINKIAEKRRRFGYPLAGNGLHANRERRRIGVMFERVGMVKNEKKHHSMADTRLTSNAVRRI